MDYKNLIKLIGATIIIGSLLITNYLSLVNGNKLKGRVELLTSEVILLRSVIDVYHVNKEELANSYSTIDSLTTELKSRKSSKTKIVYANNGLPIGMIKKNGLYIFSLILFQKQYAKYNQSAIFFNGKLFNKLTLNGVEENTAELSKRHDLDEWLKTNY